MRIDRAARPQAGLRPRPAAPRPHPAPGLPGPIALARRLTAAGEALVTVSGELDIATAATALRYVTDTIDRYRAPVVLDLGGLEFCDARGLSALLAMRRHAEQAGCSLCLVSPRTLLVRIISLTGLAGRLPVRPRLGRPGRPRPAQPISRAMATY